MKRTLGVQQLQGSEGEANTVSWHYRAAEGDRHWQRHGKVDDARVVYPRNMNSAICGKGTQYLSASAKKQLKRTNVTCNTHGGCAAR